ncbi:S8 family serine peptidase [Lysobacter sp. A6]|uniref:S8 family serine peptidase n=1 Tax=Noviluteimonas lactosilytica TaxID=2888523 RepID=A0ABS8JJ61_9GAMM|nr:S8 family serine peptidase [Lysobacter lactosilyticus]MCC8363636.1 S8 family serine peptidase [Lysobacter lactosilyticus]
MISFTPMLRPLHAAVLVASCAGASLSSVAHATSPNDPFYPNQQHLFGPQGIGANLAWATSQGAGVHVAVIDAGMAPHPDLDAALLPGYDFVDDDADARVPSCASTSGTRVAGTIAAITNNARGIAGVAPHARIVPIRVAPGCGGDAQSDDIGRAIRWAIGEKVDTAPVNANPVEVVNISLGNRWSCTPAVQSAIDLAVGRGVAVVVSAGDEGADAGGVEPANCANTIAIAGVDSQGRRNVFSNHGVAVDLAAPGQVWWPSVDDRVLAYEEGSAHAAAMASGIAALVQSAATIPLTPRHLEAMLKTTSRPFPATPDRPIGAGIAHAPTALDYVTQLSRPKLRGDYLIVPSGMNGCLIVGNNGLAERPSYHRWGGTGGPETCGLGNTKTLYDNKQAVWKLQSVTSSDGLSAYIIRSRVNDKCLIRSNGGNATTASLHMFAQSADTTWCGLANADALIANGQAAWFLHEPVDASRDGATFTQAGLKQLRATVAYLGFDSATAPGENRLLADDGWSFELRAMPLVDEAGVPIAGLPVRIQSDRNQLCLDVEGGVGAGHRLITHGCHDGQNQRFVLGNERLHVGDAKAFCVEIKDGNPALEAHIVAATCTGAVHQRWGVDGWGRFYSRMNTTLCMTLLPNPWRMVSYQCQDAGRHPLQSFYFTAP